VTASCCKRSVTVWRPSVRPSVRQSVRRIYDAIGEESAPDDVRQKTLASVCLSAIDSSLQVYNTHNTYYLLMCCTFCLEQHRTMSVSAVTEKN